MIGSRDASHRDPCVIMNLKQHTDYALRVLMYVANKRDVMVSAREISEYYDISYSHTVKVVNKLGKLGYLELKRGRYGGGMALAMEPEEINLGAVVKQFEASFDVVECFNPDKNTCPIAAECRLKFSFGKALEAFYDSLSAETLADIIPPAPK